MLVVHVHVRVKPDQVEAFREATLANAAASLKEPGVVRFDVIQELEREDRFALVEVYRTDQDPARHKETAHYATWRDTVADMLAEPRTRVMYRDQFPAQEGWETRLET